ncbi:hypothetical protein ABK040_005011 [Willaertia magna]
MVVIKRPIEHFDGYGFRNGGTTIIESSRISGHILQGRNMSGMNGILYQLSTLALTATEMFNGLKQTTMETFDRIQKLNGRIQQINEKLPQYEQYMYENNSKLLFGEGSYELTDENVQILYKKDQQNISKANNPEPLQWQYNNNCAAPPTFSDLLNKLHGDNKRCIENYTDPDFFFKSWCQRELERLKKAKQKRKEERKKQRIEGVGKNKSVAQKQVKQIAVRRKKYNTEGRLINEPTSTSNTPTVSPSQMEQVNEMNSGGIVQDEYIKSNNMPIQSTNISTPTNVPPPPMSTGGGMNVPPPPMNTGVGMNVPPPPMNTGMKVPPPPTTQPMGMNVPPPPVTVGMNIPPPPTGNSMMPTPPTMNNVNVPPPPSSLVNVPPPPSGMVNVPPPPSGEIAIKPKAPPTNQEGNVDILKNVSEKKAEMARVEVSGRSNLLDEIKNGRKLKSAAERKLAEKKEETTSVSVADILSKKFENVGGNDSDEEDSESDFSDDDW